MSIFTSIYIERYSVSMVKSTSNKDTKQAIRMLLVVVGIIVGLVAVVVVPHITYEYHETYRDRPFVDGYTYIGRDYNSPCLFNYMAIGIGCFVMETDDYYFATNHDPATLIDTFADWEMGASGETEHALWRQPNLFTKLHYYNAGNTRDSTYIYYEAYHDTQLVVKNSGLKPTDKKYVVLISRENYEKLVGGD